MTRAAFDTWLRDAHLVAEENGALVIGVPNSYAREWLDHRLRGMIGRTLKQVAGHHVEIEFVVHSRHNNDLDDLRDAGPLLANLQPAAVKSKPEQAKKVTQPACAEGLNPRYTFDEFVEGPCNRLARAVAFSAAENPGQRVNPLVICGDVGLGKSHLLHAIGHYASQLGLEVLCVSAENFTNDLVEAIRNRTTAEVREKYRSVDMLLVDDIQFIGGKDTTQEEFFHTFNALYDQGKQIVLTADRPPHDLAGLGQRLRSRLEGGMIADLATPTFETRVEILVHKAQGHQVSPPPEVLDLIADFADANIRQLEGALTRVLAHAEIAQTNPTFALAETVLGQSPVRQHDLTLDQVLEAVAEYYGVATESVRGRDRARTVSLARQVAMYLARDVAEVPLQQIGEDLGGRNHSTVLYNCSRVEDQLACDSLLYSQVSAIRETLEEVRVSSGSA